MDVYRPLHIPKRERKKGEYIYCCFTDCKTTVTDKCKSSGKALHTCKHPGSHRFQSRATDKIRKRTIPVKTYDKDLRDYKEFTRKHVIELQRFEAKGSKINETRPIRPDRLQSAVKMYFDWYQDIDVPSFKKKNFTKKTIRNEFNNLLDFKKALTSSGYDYANLLVKDISDQHVSAAHEYFGRFANKTYNNKIYTIKSLFNWLIDKGYSIKNPFDEVKNKPTTAVKTYIHPSDFNKLLEIITPENGIKFEKEKGQIKRKSLYRDWLTFYYRIALYTGGRPEGIRHLKLEDVQDNFVRVYDFKVSRKKKIDQVRMVIRTSEFDNLLNDIKDNYHLSPESYLIAPEETNRNKISSHASKSFTHYWKQLGLPYKATCYDLKDTHITLMLKRFGPSYQGIYGAHDEFETSLRNYATEEIMIKELRGKSMLG